MINIWLRVRGYGRRLAITPEFFLLFSYARILGLYVHSGVLK